MLLLVLGPTSDDIQPGVGNIAINDAFMLEAAIYKLLKAHFKKEKYYVDLLELFLEVRPRSCYMGETDAVQTTFQTEMGQLIDLLTAPEDHVDLDKFSLQKYLDRLSCDHLLKRQTPPYCRLQNRLLLVLPPRRASHAHGEAFVGF